MNGLWEFEKERYRKFQQKLYRRRACSDGMNAFLRAARDNDYDIFAAVSQLRRAGLRLLSKLIQENGEDCYVPMLPDLVDQDDGHRKHVEFRGYLRWFLQLPEFNEGRPGYMDEAGQLKRMLLRLTPERLITAFLKDPRKLPKWMS
jgi:hypothetical protein